MSEHAHPDYARPPWLVGGEFPPTHAGPAGKAWRWDYRGETEGDPTEQTTLGSWLLHCPTSHPWWPWYLLTGVKLFDVEGLPPAHRQYPEAEFELLVMALNPEKPLPAPIGLMAMPFLSPPDQCHQFHGLTDEKARELLELAARACVGGILVPDQDHRSRWRGSLANTVEHLRYGCHPGDN